MKSSSCQPPTESIFNQFKDCIGFNYNQSIRCFLVVIKPGSYCCQLLSKDQEEPEEIQEVAAKLADDQQGCCSTFRRTGQLNEEIRTALRAFLNGQHDVPLLHSSYGTQCN